MTEAGPSIASERSIWATIESTLSLFFAFVVGFVWAVIGVGMISFGRDEPEFRWAFPLWVAVMAGEAGFLLWLKWSLETGGLHPFIPEFALRQYRWPIALRPIAAGWWILHLAPTLGAMWLVERGVGALPAETKTQVAQLAVLALFAWILSHCSLMYLLLALTALWRDRALVHFVWRFRLVMDLFLVGGLLLLSRGWH